MKTQVQVHHYIVFIKTVWEKTYVFCTICLTSECLKLLKDSTDCIESIQALDTVSDMFVFLLWEVQRRKLILCFSNENSNKENWTFDKINPNKAQWSQHAICGTSNRYNKMGVLVQNYDIILMFREENSMICISWNFVSSWYYQLYKKSCYDISILQNLVVFMLPDHNDRVFLTIIKYRIYRFFVYINQSNQFPKR